MIRKHIILLIPIAVAIVLTVWFGSKKHKANDEFKIETFKSLDGWGYNIKIKNKIFIHQELIPAISGNTPFQSEKDAEKVAHLVIKKIKRKVLPTISKRELDSLGIRNYFY